MLLALAEESAHGYALAARARELSNGSVRLTAGTLYGALDRLVAAGTIEVDREEVVNGRRRRYFRLADQGSRELADEVARLSQSIDAAAAVGIHRLGVSPS